MGEFLINSKIFNVLIYSDHFYPLIGGSENYSMDLAMELSRQGHNVSVITSDQAMVPDNFPFKIYRLAKPFSIKRININFLEIPHIVKAFKPDIFHISYQTGGENLLIPLIRILKIPIILTYHADHVTIRGRMIDELQMVSTFRMVNMILVQSKRDMNKLKRKGIPNRKLIFHNFNGIDTEKYQCSNDIKKEAKTHVKLICISRLDDSHLYKGVDHLINTAFANKNFFAEGKISLKIIGDGNLRKKLEMLVKSHNLPNVIFAGNLSGSDLLKELCSSDYLILPSVNDAEGFGRTALEAIACGIPVVVSKYAGISEIIDKYRSGIVYDPFCTPNVFEIIYESFSKYRNNIEAKVRNGYKMIEAEKLSLSTSVNYTVNLYEKLIQIKP